MLLHRAKTLVHKGFMEIIADLTPSAVSEAKIFNGVGYEESTPASPSTDSWSSDDSWSTDDNNG